MYFNNHVWCIRKEVWHSSSCKLSTDRLIIKLTPPHMYPIKRSRRMITGYASVLGTLSWCTLSHHVCKKGKKKKKWQEIIFDFPDRIAFLIITRSSFNCDRIKKRGSYLSRSKTFFTLDYIIGLKSSKACHFFVVRSFGKCITDRSYSSRSKKKRKEFWTLAKAILESRGMAHFCHTVCNVSFNWKRLLMVVNINIQCGPIPNGGE